MKTFRRYLLSYICTLLVPITILSVIIMNIITDYCGAQVIANNVSALSQLEASVQMQISQMDAYALQTSQRSEFFARTLQKTGAFYNVQRVLSNWTMASSFFEAAYYHNTELETVYGFNGVYTLNYFGQRMASETGASQKMVADLLKNPGKKVWMRGPLPEGSLYYSSCVRMTPDQKGLMIFEINPEALHRLIRSSALYPECSTYLYAADGTLLYTDSSNGTQPPEELFSQLNEGSGVIQLQGEEMLYARKDCKKDNLTFVNLVPKRIANEPLHKLTMSFAAGLLLIFALGSTVIALVMRANYVPIRRLEHDALSAQVLEVQTDDAVTNVRNALRAMQSRNLVIVRHTEALSKERLILRLLLGGYSSAEAFNADGAELGLTLSGNCWHVALLRGEGSACEEEDFAPRLIDAANQTLTQPILYLEIPEHHSIVFIVQGEVQHDASALEAKLMADGLTVRVLFSRVCSHPEQLAAAYAELIRMISPGGEISHSTNDSSELYDALKNALEFGEASRIDFALSMLKTAIRETNALSSIHALIYDVLHLVHSWMENRRDTEGSMAVRALAHVPPDGVAQCEEMLNQLGSLLSTRLSTEPEQQNTLLKDMESYLEDNYRDENFTVQRVADHFQLSISNLSHYFKNHIGVSVSEYVERLRIQSAREMLLQTNLNVADIAHAVGYAQPATFMRAFKKVCGVSPTVFRNKDSSVVG